MRGHIRQRGTTWCIVLDLGRDAAGKRRQKWVSGFETKREANKALTKMLSDLDTGGFVEPTKITVTEYVERWLTDYAAHNVARKTYERYVEIARCHLEPALGHHPLSKLHPMHIQAYYSESIRTGRKDGKGGLSAQTVLHHHRVLREALQQAVRWQLLARNPADAVEPPRPQSREMKALDEQQTAYLLKAAESHWMYIPVLLAVTTGMRRGELLALRWANVNLQAGTLAVRESVELTRDGTAIKQPKTQKGRRSISLPPLVVDALRAHEIEQKKNRLMLGPGYDDHGFVCAHADGRLLSPGYVTKAFPILLKQADLPRVRFHDLRHSHASQLLRAGIHPKVVSERLGHSTVGITLDTYSHLLPGMQEEAANRIDAALRTAMANQGNG